MPCWALACIARPAFAQTRTIVDSAGRKVMLPARIDRVFVAGPPASVLALYAGPRRDGGLDPHALARREGISRQPGARSARDRPPHRTRRHGEPGGGWLRPSSTWSSTSARRRRHSSSLADRVQSQTGIPLRPHRRSLRGNGRVAEAGRRHAGPRRTGRHAGRLCRGELCHGRSGCWPAYRPADDRGSISREGPKDWRPAAAARSTPRSSSVPAPSTSPRNWAAAAISPMPRWNRSSPGSPTSSSRSTAPSSPT